MLSSERAWEIYVCWAWRAWLPLFGCLVYGCSLWLTVLWSCRSVSYLTAKPVVDEFVDDVQTSAMIYLAFSASMLACIGWDWRRVIRRLLIVLNKYHLLWCSLSRRLDSDVGSRGMLQHCRTAMRGKNKKETLLATCWMYDILHIYYLNGVARSKPFMTLRLCFLLSSRDRSRLRA